MLGTGVLLGQIISGFIIQSMGISGTFAISALIFCLILPLMYFVVVETTYTTPRNITRADEKRPETPGSSTDSDLKGDVIITEPKESYKNQLRLYRGRLSDESFWKGVIKPFPLICFPAVIFSTLVYASFFCWLLMIGVLSVTIFSAPPYNLNPAQIGLTNIPLAIGALIFSPISGWMADAIPVWMAKRNGGIFEPEFRLVLMLIAVPFSTAGFIGFGISAAEGLSTLR